MENLFPCHNILVFSIFNINTNLVGRDFRCGLCLCYFELQVLAAEIEKHLSNNTLSSKESNHHANKVSFKYISENIQNFNLD